MTNRLEQFVRRMVEDASFRELATSDPEKAAAAFGLTGPERQGALKLCASTSGPVESAPQGFWV